ncbi:hypothetical protein VF04_04305 [Nostoc linckia z7]|uniref:Uncharacterized protein n=2 Tax=Nostoc linckia TaxID=92942 RepID=A0A9Q6ENH2_NOSLI|nr:hypothetical protein VF02_11790 [Nostoc linckia z1]PHJ70190.1 hypothetical protein VF05_11950 [Nostoc linckia z3]PHJ75091.1 hypothetical protein VF03_12110 [Nostoc linckia z2]PHJ82979.1 hypothetical protein VF06_14610 [Nostoc linckia z4]PHJ89076.1 hypothetical protein VF07_13805 [Nostoc linckia z6]PHK00135.1 hypothetical protein VF04_04305 [Nostoc linckia z7]PHK06798.1 hypothetical protein VF08_03435 [Nostoc linckia z8]PHK23199.1 hypothetical protein VF11_02490 [Nostoc linckia z14]PHK269
MPISWGLNYSPWIKLSFPVDVPQTCVKDAIFTYYVGNTLKVQHAIWRITEVINQKRKKYGFQISSSAIAYICQKIENYNKKCKPGN